MAFIRKVEKFDRPALTFGSPLNNSIDVLQSSENLLLMVYEDRQCRSDWCLVELTRDDATKLRDILNDYLEG